MADEEISLKWIGYQNNILLNVKELFKDEGLSDVTVVSDGHSFKAHKVILSANSLVFRAIFQQNLHKDPIIVLHDINTAALRLLLTFMYHGEANVTEEFLPVLMKTAEALKICGLSKGSKVAQDNGNTTTNTLPVKRKISEHEDSNNKTKRSNIPPAKNDTPTNRTGSEDPDEIANKIPKEELVDLSQENTNDSDIDNDTYNDDNDAEIDSDTEIASHSKIMDKQYYVHLETSEKPVSTTSVDQSMNEKISERSTRLSTGLSHNNDSTAVRPGIDLQIEVDPLSLEDRDSFYSSPHKSCSEYAMDTTSTEIDSKEPIPTAGRRGQHTGQTQQHKTLTGPGEGSSSQFADISYALGPEEKLFHHEKAGKNLRQLLSTETTGKKLLEKSEKEPLSRRDRAYIVKLIVESELKCLEKLNNTIKKDVWMQWANEISQLFKGESSDVYYMPYKVVGGKVIPASGLIHNRLITHRRSLAPEGCKRKGSGSESNILGKASDCGIKRVRPFPEGFKVVSVSESSSLDEQLNWLRSSSSPFDVVIAKWQATFNPRNKLLESLSCLEYFNTFPALQLPIGYKLLSNDFEAVYPGATKTFNETFPIIKSRLLKLLAKKCECARVDQQTLDLLELASVGEEQANIAAFLSIVTLLRQMPTICLSRKKLWKPSREEVRCSFLGRVSTVSDIEKHCNDRQALIEEKGMPNHPYILAVGSSWSNVIQYEIIIHKGLRYHFSDICSAIKHTYHIYWALDYAYSKDSAPCWMFIQRAMFQMKSEYDTESIPLRELLAEMND